MDCNISYNIYIFVYDIFNVNIMLGDSMRKVNWTAVITWSVMIITGCSTLYAIIFMLRAIL